MEKIYPAEQNNKKGKMKIIIRCFNRKWLLSTISILLTLLSTVAYSKGKDIPVSISLDNNEHLISVTDDVANYSISRTSFKNGKILKGISIANYQPALLPKNDGTGKKILSSWKSVYLKQSDGVYSEIASISVTRKTQSASEKNMNYKLFFYYKVNNGIVTSIDATTYSKIADPVFFTQGKNGEKIAAHMGSGKNRTAAENLAVGKSSSQAVRVTDQATLKNLLGQSLNAFQVTLKNNNEIGER